MSEVNNLATENRRKSRKKEHKDVLKTALDIPQVITPGVAHIEMDGNREVAIDGCRGILEYEEDKIKLNTGNLLVSFIGSNLEIKVYSDIQTVVVGDIISIEFEN